MKILGTANIRDYCGIVCGKGLVVDCTEEEFKETGNRYIRDKNNLFQGKYFSLIFHNEPDMSGYSPSYYSELCKKLGYKFTRHVSNNDAWIVNFKPIITFEKIKMM